MWYPFLDALLNDGYTDIMCLLSHLTKMYSLRKWVLGSIWSVSITSFSLIYIVCDVNFSRSIRNQARYDRTGRGWDRMGLFHLHSHVQEAETSIDGLLYAFMLVWAETERKCIPVGGPLCLRPTTHSPQIRSYNSSCLIGSLGEPNILRYHDWRRELTISPDSECRTFVTVCSGFLLG